MAQTAGRRGRCSSSWNSPRARLAQDTRHLVSADPVQMVLKVEYVEKESHHATQLQIDRLRGVVVILQRLPQAEVPRDDEHRGSDLDDAGEPPDRLLRPGNRRKNA